MNRRSFLNIGSLALGGLGIPELRASDDKENIEKSVILIFLAGGMSHYESFNSHPSAVDKYRSTTGYIQTKSGFYMGGHWDRLAQNSGLFTLVQGFGHSENGHQSASHFVNTGKNGKDENLGAKQKAPSYGSIVSKTYGISSHTGLPNYIATKSYFGDGADYLGANYGPMVLNDETKRTLTLDMSTDRFNSRRSLLSSLDKSLENDKIDRVIDGYKDQSYGILLGDVKRAFEIDKEPESIRKLYGDTKEGQNALLARRLVQNGAKFVTVTRSGYDFHNDIQTNMEKAVPPTDQFISALLIDLKNQGMLKNTMVVVTTEFGRTPLNGGNRAAGGSRALIPGRDHAGQVTPLLLGGGSYSNGNIIGSTDRNGFAITSNPYRPLDLLYTIMNHMNISKDKQFIDNSGRPRFIIDGESRLIV